MAGPHYDEMRDEDGAVREHFRSLAAWLADTPAERVAEKRREADLLFHRVGITFAVYGDEEGAERLIPFDTIPRVIPQAEWNELARGLEQRVTALNRFLHDIYHGQEILKAGVIPAEQVLTNDAYEVSMGLASAIDGSGDVLVVGTTYGTLPGQPSVGGQDAFVTRLDSG